MTSISKKIGNYEIKFKTSFDKKSDEAITLELSVSEDLLKLINEVCVLRKEEETTSLSVGEGYLDFQRYKIKSFIAGSIYSDSKYLLFSKILADTGKFKAKFYSARAIDRVISDLKEDTRTLVQVYLKYSNLDVSIKYNLAQ